MSKILMVIRMVNLLSMPIQCPQRKKCQKKTKKNKSKMAVFHQYHFKVYELPVHVIMYGGYKYRAIHD